MKLSAESVPEPPRPGMFSNARRCGDRILVSGMHAGQGADGPVGGDDPYLQAREALRRVIALVEAAGGQATDIVAMRIYLTSIDDVAEVGRARSEFLVEPMPTSTVVEVSRLVHPRLKVEVEAEAMVEQS